jgi:nucleotide-binding universal stress UspA family protein
MLKVDRILFPCDLTENSLKVLPHVLTMADKYGSKIFLLYVDELHEWGGHFIPHPSLDALRDQALDVAGKLMNKMCEEKLQGCPHFEKRLISGDAATEILKFIESERIDLVIMGTHGRKGMEHTIFGSVAENVVKRSPVPVLVVNPHTVGQND